MRFSMHDSWCNLLIKILDLTWICWEQGNNIAPQGVLRSDGWKPLFGEAIQCIFSCRIRHYAPCATSGFRGGPREGAFCRPYTQPRQPQATLSIPTISL